MWLPHHLLTENSLGDNSCKMKPFELQPQSVNLEQRDAVLEQRARYALPRICQNLLEEHLYSARFHANQLSSGKGGLVSLNDPPGQLQMDLC